MNKEISREDILRYMESGCKPESEWACGTEYEKFAYRKSDFKPLTYDGAQGLEAFLEAFHQKFGWQPQKEDGHIVGLISPEGGPRASITTEPAGQIELSGAPFATVHENAAEIDLYKKQMGEIGKALGVGFLGIGYAPVWKLTDMHPIPKKRYAIISRYMAQNSVMGIDMMYRSCTVQVNMDFSDEADMVMKMRLGLALQPITSALFASSPFVDGKPNGYITNRVNIWRYADPQRSGLLPEAFEDGFGFERYVDYALDIPIYFVERGGRYLDGRGQTFRDFLEGKLEILPNERPLISDWETHLATIYPEARLKKFIEMRGADSGWTSEHLIALPALWTGLLYNAACREAAWDLVKDWDEAMREEARVQAIHKGLGGQLGGRPMLDIAKEIVEIAREGLNKRDIKNDKGENESIYLSALDDRLESGKTAADRLLDLYNGEWGGDSSKIFSVDATNLPD